MNRVSIRSEADAALIRGRGRMDAEIPRDLKDEMKSGRCPGEESYMLENHGCGTFEVGRQRIWNNF